LRDLPFGGTGCLAADYTRAPIMNDNSAHQAPGPETTEMPRQIVVARQVYPQNLPIIALPGRPFFPKMVMPLAVETPALAALVARSMPTDLLLPKVVA
jgi:hypothetical protein